MSQPLRPSPKMNPWKVFGIVVLTLAALWVAGLVFDFFGSGGPGADWFG